MKKLILLLLPLLFTFMSTQAQTIDIGLHSTTCSGFEIVLRPTTNLSGTALTNVQFTIKWPDAVNLTNAVPNYPLAQQGATFSDAGYSYATYVGIDWQGITWSAGTEYTVLTFSHDLAGSGTGDFIIMPAGDPKATIQTVFYIEQWGLEVTGFIYAGASGVDLGKCPLYITGSFEANDKIYDGLTDATFLANNLALNGVFAGDAVSLTGVEIHFATADAGTDIPVYIAGASLSGADAAKYELFLTGAPSALADITPKAIAVTADPKSKIYGEADPALTYQFTPALIGSDVFTGALTRVAGENVGTYAILQGTLALSANYILNYTGANLTITELTIFVSADPKSKIYGEADPALTYQFAPALIGSDVFTGDLTRVAGENVGTYAILQGTMALSTNYILSYTGANLTITELNIAVTADLQSKIYGEAEPALTYQFAPALIGSDVFTGALTRVAGENVGTYAILQGTLALSGNYTLDFTSAGFNITPKGLSVTADNKSKVFDGSPFTGFTVSYDGFVFGEDETALGGTLIFTGDAVGATEVGTYTITPSGLTSSNYDITFYDGQLEITPVGRTLKVFLQGAYNPGTGEMNTGIISQLPTTQPYNVNPWFYNGIESVDPIPAGMVDWVLVDLRISTEAGSLYERRAGILYNDGTVAVEFSTIEPGVGYYIVVGHRNHMPVMSANAVELYDITSAYDFTLISNCFGANPVILLDGTNYGMIAGDVNSNGVLQYSGPGNDRGMVIAKIVAVSGSNNINASITNGYWDEDINLDNTVLYLGTGNDRAIIYQNLNTLVGPELNNIYISEVPGVFEGSKSSESGSGVLDIALSVTQSDLMITLIGRESIANGLVDNIQFTLAWKKGDDEIASLLKSYSSGFMLTPQGNAEELNGIVHQVFASINPVALPNYFEQGEEITLITFENNLGLFTGNRIWIADNDFTSSKNGMYYISIWGVDQTGKIMGSSLGFGHGISEKNIRIYPNPVREGILNVSFGNEQNGDYTVLIFNMFGQVIYESVIKSDFISKNTATLDIKHLRPGSYMIYMQNGSATFREMFIVK